MDRRPISTKNKLRFVDLLVGSSPEILSGDGEFSAAQRRQREQQIKREWVDLEEEVGRTISEEEAYTFWDEEEVKAEHKRLQEEHVANLKEFKENLKNK